MDIGKPRHIAVCTSYCNRVIGGPYFDIQQARARVKEHVLNFHSDTVFSKEKEHTPRPRPTRPRIRAAYQ